MYFRWAYDGVNDSIPRNTGPECAGFLTPGRRLAESLFFIPFCLLAIKLTVSRLKPITFRRTHAPFSGSTPQHLHHHQLHHHHQTGSSLGLRSSSISHLAASGSNHNLQHHYQRIGGGSGHHIEPDHRELLLQQHHHRRSSSVEYCSCHRCSSAAGISPEGEAPSWFKQLLLVTMTLTLGIEIGFKFATRTVIYILNPCHITTMMQIYLLTCNKPKKSTTALFRIQMNYFNGPVLAFLLPETDNRQIPLEAAIYWIQHALMCIIPIYLLKCGGAYNMEAINDFSWNIIGYAILITYHFVVLQGVAIPTWINLNHMLCPAIKDPFDGPNYRIAAFIHEAILCTLLCKLVTFLFSPMPPPVITNPPFIKNGGSSSGSTDQQSSTLPTPLNPSPLATSAAGSGGQHHFISRPSSRHSSRSSSPAKSVSMLQENNIIIKTSKID